MGKKPDTSALMNDPLVEPKVPFNRLTPAEAEVLALLAEECGELVQVIGKILRHGIDSRHPDSKQVTNRDLLEKEMGDVQASMRMICDAKLASKDSVYMCGRRKIAAVTRWLHHAKPTYCEPGEPIL